MLYIQQSIYSDHQKRETEHILVCKICADGRPHYGWLCTESGRFSYIVRSGKKVHWQTGGYARNQARLHGGTIEELPTVGEPDRTPCFKCKSTGGVQQHHIMPHAIHSAADTWRTVPLCVKCHAELHKSLDVRKLT